ncbi:MAG: glucose-6-phosphate isomerase [Betaproteobacteria bacterium SG8_41]|nr:MAG: glucose-6-phosphate isomerase [Betaproteobacteria bacterium SG8_41]
MAASRTQLPAWRALEQHRTALADVRLRRLFEEDPRRFDRLSVADSGILLDYSKQAVTPDTMRLLLALARECDLENSIRRLFSGERVNTTENRAALHMALRAAKPMMLDGSDVTRDVAAVLSQMKRLVAAVRNGRARGATGRKFTDIVNIGIGGSDLGPRLVCDALARDARSPLRAHFVSNVDGSSITSVLQALSPATTLVIVASKTFTTAETLTNGLTARSWLERKLRGKAAIARHLCAVSSAPARAVEFGVPAERVFKMWDWVGGRYSLWSAVGLPIALALGMARFEELRAGARAIDEHFAGAPLARNLPVLLGLLEVWNVNFRGAATRAVLPYDERLRLLPSYLQQLEMESCGKSATLDGGMVDYATAPVTWGTPGTDGQHAYFQMLHQGTAPVPADFIACCRPHHPLRRHHDMLLANFLAQTEALARGMTPDEAAASMRGQGVSEAEIMRLLPHRVFPGNRPTTSILLDALNPRTLGALIALYEHKVFVQSVIWNINAFDQWGVELGKQLANRILPELEGAAPVAGHDASTLALIRHYRVRRQGRKA